MTIYPIREIPTADDYLVEVMMVDVENLFVDHQYQRAVSKGRVKYLVNNWNWKRYFPIIIAHRGGSNSRRYAVIDGQQRFMAAQELGLTKLPAIFIVASSLEAEAELFLGANTSKPVGAGDRFKARLVIKDPTALGILKTVRAMGFDLACALEEGQQRNLFTIDAVQAVEYINNQDMLATTLSVIQRAWGAKPTSEMTTASILRGTYLALRHIRRYGVSFETFADRIGTYTTGSELQNKSNDRYASMTGSKSIPGAVAAIEVEVYNLHLKAKIPPYTTTVGRSFGAAHPNVVAARAKGTEAGRTAPHKAGGRFTKKDSK